MPTRPRRPTFTLGPAGAAFFLCLAPLLTGCASSYVTPGGPADLAAVGVAGVSDETRAGQTDPGVAGYLDKEPLAKFPTAIAVARIQSPGYSSYRSQGYGTGRYSVVTTRDAESDASLERLQKLPMVAGIAPIGRMILSPDLQDDYALREAAAKLRADVLLVYTFDTQFRVAENARPLSVVTLGLAPSKQARVVTTASAALLDTRNGYVYGTAEATETQKRITNAWQSDEAVDAARRETESAAFDALVGELEATWRGVVARYAVAE